MSKRTKQEPVPVVNDLKPVTKRLEVIIRLMLDQQLAEGKIKRKDQLLFMDSVGLSTGEIAGILGQSSKDVSSSLKKARDEKKTKQGKRKENEQEKQEQ